MKPKITPGPWEAYNGSVSSKSKSIDRSKWSTCIHSYSANLRMPEHEKVANAKLIAEAPEMFDVLACISDNNFSREELIEMANKILIKFN